MDENAPWKPISLAYVPAIFTQEQFNKIYQDYINITNELAAEYTNLMSNGLADNFLQKYNRYLLYSLFLSLLSKERKTVQSKLKDFIINNLNSHSIAEEYKNGARWIILISRRMDLHWQIVRTKDPLKGMFFAIPLIAIAIDDKFWQPQYSSIEEYEKAILEGIDWEKAEQKISVLSTLGPILRLTRFD